jgi:V/A-type H+-transporting ATPase subunit I
MIVPMRKYAFWIHVADYDGFLAAVRALGMLHVRRVMQAAAEAEPSALQQSLAQLSKAIRLINTRKATDTLAPPLAETNQALVAQDIWQTQEQADYCRQQIQIKNKELQQLAPWGDFSLDTLHQIREAGWTLTMFICPASKFDPAWRESFALVELTETGPDKYFVIIHPIQEQPALQASELPWPALDPGQLRAAISTLQAELKTLEERLNSYAAIVNVLEDQQAGLQEQTDEAEVKRQTRAVADDQVMLLEGFIPQEREQELVSFLERWSVVYLAARPKPEDAPPVQLRNSRFASLFEPISKMYALPAYGELDLTPFFAPFFMLFFGFCLGDAGYGLVVLLGSMWYQGRADAAWKPLFGLAQLLGLATILFGILTGTFFGVNLLQEQYAWLGQLRLIMLDSNQAFNLALILGFIQTIYGLVLQAINKYRQFGWPYAVSPIGWIILLISLLDMGIVGWGGILTKVMLGVGIAMIIIFSSPESGLLGRLGKGLWDLYGITGFFGDLLSYIRLFALGISSAVLGFVINDIALQIKDSMPVLGPIMFVAFLVVGHGANLLISSLGSFVHPMRLTFVEFYKNAGFSGGGVAYSPFASRKKNNNKT